MSQSQVEIRRIGCYYVKKLFLFPFIAGLLLTNVAIAQAQTLQNGVVKTRGRMVNGTLVPGEKIGNAMVSIRGRSAVLSGSDGSFRFPVTDKTFIVDSVKKKDYALIDYEACRQYRFPQSPFVLLMEKPEKQRADQLAAERKIRRNLQRQLKEREDEIEALQASQQQKDSLLHILYQQQGDNEKLIADMVKRYSTMDYDQLDEFYRQVSWFIENGELIRADSLLRTRGDISMQVQGILNNGKAIQEQREQIQKAETVHQVDIEEAARRCYSYYETCFAQCQNDSAAYYLELRASLDTTNIYWQKETADFIFWSPQKNYDKVANYYNRILGLLGEQGGQWDLQNSIKKSLAMCYTFAGLEYKDHEEYNKAIDFHEKALALRAELFGEDSQQAANSYQSIGSVYNKMKEFDKALCFINKALSIRKKELVHDHPYIASCYKEIGIAYAGLGDYSKALQSLEAALTICENVLGIEDSNTKSILEEISRINSLLSQ